MNKTANYFSRRLHFLFTITDRDPVELARRLNLPPSVVQRWEEGAASPNVYQFREIAAFFGLPYEWFLDGTDGVPDPIQMSGLLGLREETVEALMELADSEPEEVLDAVDDAVYGVLSAVAAVRDDMEEE